MGGAADAAPPRARPHRHSTPSTTVQPTAARDLGGGRRQSGECGPTGGPVGLLRALWPFFVERRTREARDPQLKPVGDFDFFGVSSTSLWTYRPGIRNLDV